MDRRDAPRTGHRSGRPAKCQPRRRTYGLRPLLLFRPSRSSRSADVRRRCTRRARELESAAFSYPRRALCPLAAPAGVHRVEPARTGSDCLVAGTNAARTRDAVAIWHDRFRAGRRPAPCKLQWTGRGTPNAPDDLGLARPAPAPCDGRRVDRSAHQPKTVSCAARPLVTLPARMAYGAGGRCHRTRRRDHWRTRLWLRQRARLAAIARH